jgi:hypothetical protein
MSTALTLPSIDQGFLSFADIDFSFLLNPQFLSTDSVLSMLQSFTPGLGDLTETLTDLSGSIIIEEGVFQTSLNLPDNSTLVRMLDLPALLESYAALAAITDGQASLGGGILTANITTGEESVSLENFDLASFLGTQVFNLVNGINGTIPFEKGAFIVDIDSTFGPIDGTVDFANGDLNIDLLTPFGGLYLDADFGEEANFSFIVPTPFGDIDAVVDLNAGNVIASLGFFNISQPLSEFDGSLILADGVATIETEVPFLGAVQTELEVGTLASEYVAELIRGLDATVSITDGVLNAFIEGDSDLLVTNFDIAAFTQQGAEFFREVDGLVTFNGGNLTAAIQTPLGELNGSYSVVDMASPLQPPVTDPIAG